MCKSCVHTAYSKKARKRVRRWQSENLERTAFGKKKANATRKGIEFTITLEDIHWPDVCPVLGIPLKFSFGSGGGGGTPNSPSFDRIDPTKGYVKGNVIIVSNKANTIKSYGTPDDLERVAAFYRQLVH